MNDEDIATQELEILHAKLNQLIAAYNELKTLNETDAHQETLREGFLVKAGKNTETILKYICKKEGIAVTTKPQNGKIIDARIPTLNDYIYHLREKKIINEDIHHHLEIIKKWRNRSAHDLSADDSTIDFIKDSTIESVNDSFNHFKNWFFKKYLKGQADFSKNKYSKVTASSTEDGEEINIDLENNSQNGTLPASKEIPRKKKNIGKIFVLLITISAVIICLFYFYNY